MSKDIKATKVKCHVCGVKFDPQKYQQHHKKCLDLLEIKNRKK